MVRRLHADIKGFTLTEILLVVTLAGILALMAAPLVKNVIKSLRVTQTKTELQTEARTAMSAMTRNLRAGIASTVSIGRLNADQLQCSKIEFVKIAKTEGTQNILMKYYQDGPRLYEVVNGSTRTLTENLRFVSFIFPKTDDTSLLAISLTLEKQDYLGQHTSRVPLSDKVQIMNP